LINGKMLADAMVSGANNIVNQHQAVDSLNVFPVPDGDTGTNMSMTMGAAKRELLALDPSAGVGEVAQCAASALLRGARGNSGVITSLLFRGFAKGLKNKQNACAEDLVNALEIGVSSAYKAVMKPTEGTMLTVARVSAEKARAALRPEMTEVQLWNIVLSAAKEALDSTPELLPVLKKAGVVDAGGQGLLVIFEGMGKVFEGKPGIEASEPSSKNDEPLHVDTNAFGEYEGEITFTYCTEFIISKDDSDKDAVALRAKLEAIGDCVVVVEDEKIVKCHVHTNAPGTALQYALDLGMLTLVKIDNMREQYEKQKAAAAAKEQNKVALDPDAPNGFVAVAAGDGVRNLFLDLGVNAVVSGGQTMNPSTDDILKAIESLPNENIFVLPNNKNIIMAAEQAAKISTRRVTVIPTMSIPQGLAAMLAFDYDAKPDQNAAVMTQMAQNVGTGQITFAARDSEYDGKKIHEGELLALENGKVSFTEQTLSKAAVRLVKQLLKKDSSFVTLIYGSDVTEEAAHEVEHSVREKLPDTVDLALVKGEQPVYYFIISVE